MSVETEALKTQLEKLPDRDRAELAVFLIRSLDEEVDAGTDAGWDAAWDEELARRWQEIESGAVRGEPGEEVLARLRARYS
jgi:putative addiction module component (TIGR02574 family)